MYVALLSASVLRNSEKVTQNIFHGQEEETLQVSKIKEMTLWTFIGKFKILFTGKHRIMEKTSTSIQDRMTGTKFIFLPEMITKTTQNYSFQT
jgi:predicted membrane protein